MHEFLASTLTWIFSSIPQIIILVACIMYVSKKSDADSVLMLVGTIIGILVHFFHSAIPVLSSRDILNYAELNPILIVTNIIGFIGASAFAVGLLLLIQKVLKLKLVDN